MKYFRALLACIKCFENSYWNKMKFKVVIHFFVIESWLIQINIFRHFSLTPSLTFGNFLILVRKCVEPAELIKHPLPFIWNSRVPLLSPWFPRTGLCFVLAKVDRFFLHIFLYKLCSFENIRSLKFFKTNLSPSVCAL